MSRPFAITAPLEALELDEQRSGRVVFTLTNETELHVVARATVLAEDPRVADWVRIEGRSEKDFGPAETNRIVTQVTVPADVEAGIYPFRLLVADLENPDDRWAEGPSVSVYVGTPVPSPPPPRRAGGWWWWLVAGGAVVVVGIVVAVVLLTSGKDEPVAAPEPEPEPEPVLATLAVEAMDDSLSPGQTGLIEARALGEDGEPFEAAPPFDDATQWSWTVEPTGRATVTPVAQGASLACTEGQSGDLEVTVRSADGAHVASVSLTCEEPEPAAPLTASFEVLPKSGRAPLEVLFASTTERVTAWAWDFGDGATSSAPNPRHTYERAGTYTVTLTVTGDDGQSLEVERAGVVRVQCAQDHELCNGRDDNCNERVDETCPAGIALSSASSTRTVGGGGGSGFRRPCGPGEALVGVDGRAGSRLDQLRPVCATLQLDVDRGRTPEFGYRITWRSPVTQSPVGGGGGSDFVDRCPAGQVVVGMHGRAGSEVDAFGIRCATVSFVRNGSGFTARIDKQGARRAHGGGGGGGFALDCAGIGGGLSGKAGSRVDQVRLDCKAVGLQ